MSTQYPSLDVTKTGNTFVVKQAGNYEIIYRLLVNADKTTTVTTVCRKNGTTIAGSENSQTMNTKAINIFDWKQC